MTAAEANRIVAQATRDIADYRDAIKVLRAIHDMAATARRGFENHAVVNGRTALRRIEEEALDCLTRVGAAP